VKKFALLLLALLVPAAHAALQAQVQDHDTLALPSSAAGPYDLMTVRSASGQLLLVDQSAISSPRDTALGITVPAGVTAASFAASANGNVYAAFATAGGAYLFDLGDLAQSGPLHPVQLGSVAAAAGFDPQSVQVGIIAILIGLLVDPSAPALYVRQNGHMAVFAYDGKSLRNAVFDGTSNTMMVVR